ncbi:MAG: hypothetical protein FWD78_03010 [Treponema sp.]|nr:hypothetical protein [Treponema sp.]
MQNDFIDLVRQMRAAQNKYFLHRESSDLRTAKAWEARVDEAIVNFDRSQDKTAQPELEIY